ncbi:hypothetical protein ACRALDRAFT_1078287 [Sodiomyces alcalophilus JCM 7366]|uniref:uncharacterized protein n=1 Tax=Sodiomyces alcalophilus JCM 7366 TaxID=591952 RepID=UPI0039B41999
MAGRYERVNAHEYDDDLETNVPSGPRQAHPIPNSPPPSFHSRQTSPSRGSSVDPALADAFGADDDESDDEADDRQRLVRGNSFPVSNASSSQLSASPQPQHTTIQSEGGAAAATSSAQAPLPSGRVYGGGTANEGVFSNLMAKPERGGEEKDEQPPTYEEAAADAAPPYWETTILAPGLGGPDEVFIDGMPVGSFFSFVWNATVSMSFSFVGFLLTYLLHSTHAAKNGSRFGLGVTLIQYGFYMRADIPQTGAGPQMDGSEGYSAPPDPNAHDFNDSDVTSGGGGLGDISGPEWISFILMVIGWFISIRSISDYIRARGHEMLVLRSPDRGLPVPIIAEGESSERVV